jgi:hypothetical protein
MVRIADIIFSIGENRPMHSSSAIIPGKLAPINVYRLRAKQAIQGKGAGRGNVFLRFWTGGVQGRERP